MAVWDRWDRIIVVMRPMAPLRRSARCRPPDATRGSGSRPSARSGTTRPTRSPTRAGASLSVPITVAPIMRRNVRVKYAASENPAQPRSATSSHPTGPLRSLAEYSLGSRGSLSTSALQDPPFGLNASYRRPVEAISVHVPATAMRTHRSSLAAAPRVQLRGSAGPQARDAPSRTAAGARIP